MIKRLQRIAWLILLCVLVAGNVQAQPQINSFTSGSYAEILKQYQGKALVIALWSLDCPSCYNELAMLAEEYQQQDFNLVLISVDGAEARSEVESVIKKYKLDNVDGWLFKEHSEQSLRYEIDPLWYGEVPRSYIFNKTHQRSAVSGVLSVKDLSK